MGLRIVLASDFYGVLLGGAERQAQLLARELVARGHQVTLATVRQASDPPTEQDGGISVVRFDGLSTRTSRFSSDPNRRLHPPFPDPAVVHGLRRLLASWTPDLVHAQGWVAYSCAAAVTGTSVPLLLSVRDYGYACAIRTLLRHEADGRREICDGPALAKCLACASRAYGVPKAGVAVSAVLATRPLLHRVVAGVHAISTYVEQTVRRDILHGQPPEHEVLTRVIPDIIQPSRLAEERDDSPPGRMLAGLPDGPFILFVGALQPHKGVNVLLDAYGRLTSPPPLILMGTIWSDSPSTFPKGVTVLPNVPHGDVMHAWDRCSFGVAPALWPEPLGNVIMEAMSRGRAVVASAVGGPVDSVLDGVTGLLVPPGDAEALAKAMQRLVLDAGLRDRLGEAGRIRAERFRADVLVPQFEALYAELVRRHPGRRSGARHP